MKIVIPIEFYRKGGVERVIISLIPNLLPFVEQIIFLIPRGQIPYFQSVLPESEKFVYEDFAFYKNSVEPKIFALYDLLAAFYKTIKLERIHELFSRRLVRLRIEARINQVIDRYGADHCFYPMINRVTPPNLKVPLSGLSHDLFWRFAPLTYSESYRETYDELLKEWLDKADIIFTNSRKTKNEILRVFPNATYERKIKAIPLAGSIDRPSTENTPERSDPVTFYYPSSFGIYKDHLTLVKAAVKLARKDLNFKIVLIGKETDSLLNGKLQLSQQSKTEEYRDYLEECNRIHAENREIIDRYIEGLGYQDYETLEFYYRICSCVVFTSKYEGFGLALAESIVRGIPAIVSDLEVFREQVELYNCGDRTRFFPAGDADALADRLEEFIRAPIPRLLPEDIPSKINLWTWEDVAKEYIATFQENAR
ncbi:glycosyltransferase [Pannus brasiliensis CCIBt3594]|uniref:Glycosyltransferase n=1 Tax=Pannus brasiliensis CCIBt3594 TaxID=1427578 RepID=A0AAW9QQY2_9CHRO